jgi:hypothetical protein
MCDRAGLANCQELRPDLLRLRSPRHRVSLQFCSDFHNVNRIRAQVLTAIFALRGHITAVIPKKLLGFMRRFLGMTCTRGERCVVGVLYALAKERNVKLGRTHIGNSG